MSKRFVLPFLLLSACGLATIGCGSGDGIAAGARQGPLSFGLPFLPSLVGEDVTIGFKNLTSADAPVWVTAYEPGGGAYAPGRQALVVPAQGELREPLVTFTGAAVAGGWICVETRDVNDLDAVTGEPLPLPTSGYVLPYLHRVQIGGNDEVDAVPGLTGRSSGVSIAVTPATDTVQILNYSFAPNGLGAIPVGHTFEIRTFGTDGAQVGATATEGIAANGSFSFTPAVATGSIRIEPMTPIPAGREIRYAAAARENGFHNHVESRFTEASTSHWGGLVDLGFEAAFGQDAAGNVHDFGLLMSNPSASTETVVLQAIYRKGGAPILTAPRAYVLGSGRTVLMRTRTQDSAGLEPGEESWFDDLFGDVFQAIDLSEFTLVVQAGSRVDVSARYFDPSFNAFYQVLRAIPRTHNACIYDFPLSPSTSAGRRNWVSITNTTNGTLTVPIRAFTPERGTEYILPAVSVPPLSRLDWSPDGMVIREEPTDTVGPVVPHLRLQMVPTTGALFRGRTEARDASELLIFVTPTLTRD